MLHRMSSVSSVLTILTAALAFARTETASAQPYYYEPAPDYYHNDTASGTFMGGALGAVSGAIIGGKKDRGEGALIGAGVGALTGNLLGRAKDRSDEQRAAVGAAVTAQANQQAAAMAITNYDLVSMTRAGVSDDVIISTIRSRGARLDLSPNALISLKQSGVNDRVLLAAQEMNNGPAIVYGAPRPPVVVHEVRPTVIVRPSPWRHYHYHRHRPYSHTRIYYSGP
jgi:outer membrane protein with glycine zipper